MTKTPTILDGKAISQRIREEIGREVETLISGGRRRPGLGVILVGDNPASHTYVANKEKAAKGCGFESFDIRLPSTSTYEEVRDVIRKFNDDHRIDGILLQLPLPKHIDSDSLISLIDPAKDADGLHPINQGLLMRGEGNLRPCTPSGVMKMISEVSSDISGKKAVVVGRSILVGKPVSLMLLEKNVTVTMAHSKTVDLPSVIREADIVVAALGKPEFIRGEWIKEGAIVIDVGINRTEAGKIVGDVHYESALKVASAITPVPGGVGPMTIAMLISNTLQAYKANKR